MSQNYQELSNDVYPVTCRAPCLWVISQLNSLFQCWCLQLPIKNNKYNGLLPPTSLSNIKTMLIKECRCIQPSRQSWRGGKREETFVCKKETICLFSNVCQTKCNKNKLSKSKLWNPLVLGPLYYNWESNTNIRIVQRTKNFAIWILT